MALTKEKILLKLARRERQEPSEVFGGELTLRELTRAEFRAIREAATLPDGLIDVDRWNGGLFCAGTIDGKGEPLFTLDELLALPQRGDLWDEIKRIADCILDFNQIGNEALKKTSPGSPEMPA